MKDTKDIEIIEDVILPKDRLVPDNSLIGFKAITNFINDLAEIFASKCYSLKLYCHLINKTTLTHETAINKHISAFKDFCVRNTEAINIKDEKMFVNSKIEYSPKVYINMDVIFKMADRDTKSVIWRHLLFISALIYPAGKAKELLKKVDKSGETDFLTDIISKVEKHVDPNSNPMEAVSSILQSGVFTDLIQNMNSGLKDGSLDLNKLLGSVKNIVSTIGNEGEDGEGGEGGEMMDVMTKMMGGMMNNTNGESGGEAPDLSNIMSMMGPLLAGMNGGVNSGEGLPNLADMMKELNDKN